MTFYLILIVFGITCFSIVSDASPVNENDKDMAVWYLQKYGYMEESISPTSITAIELSRALRTFQRYSQLRQTGELDKETVAMMQKPRCGMKDIYRPSTSATKESYAFEGLWNPSASLVIEDNSKLQPNLCQDSTLDTITRVKKGSTYVFKGNFYWKVLSNGIADGYPRKIFQDWDGLEGNLDASFTWSNGKTYFFKGQRYWRFTNKEMDYGYPKLISKGFVGIPDMLDAALVWSGNGKIYFFKGDKYWRYDSKNDPPVQKNYPRPISFWRGLPADGIDAAFQWQNGFTYFFKREQYYRFNDMLVKVDEGDPPYPRSTAVWWFDCQSSS